MHQKIMMIVTIDLINCCTDNNITVKVTVHTVPVSIELSVVVHVSTIIILILHLSVSDVSPGGHGKGI